MSKTTFDIEYAGLPIKAFFADDGVPMTPLQPLAELLGLDWSAEHARILAEPWFCRLFGLRELDCEPCIKVKSVFAYLANLDYTAMGAAGNRAGLAIAEQAIDRCCAVIRDYEESGSAVNFDHPKIKAAMEEQAGAQLRRFGLNRGDAA